MTFTHTEQTTESRKLLLEAVQPQHREHATDVIDALLDFAYSAGRLNGVKESASVLETASEEVEVFIKKCEGKR